MNEQEQQLYKMKQVARILCVSSSWLNRKALDNKFKTVWLGGNRMVHKDELARIIKEGIV